MGKGKYSVMGPSPEPTTGAEQDKFLEVGYTIDFLASIEKGIKPAMDQVTRLVSEFEWIDVCGIYLFDDERKALQLVSQCGLSEAEAGKLARYEEGSEQLKMVRSGKPFYGDYSRVMNRAGIPPFIRKFKTIAVIPLIDRGKDEVMGCINLASLRPGIADDGGKRKFELIASQVSLLVKYADTRESLRRLNEQLESQVRERTEELQKANEKLKREIALQKETTQALEYSDKLFRVIYESTDDGIILFNAGSLDLIDMNAETHRALGLGRKEFLTLGACSMSLCDRQHPAGSVIAEIRESGQKRYRVVHDHKDGGKVHRNITATLLRVGEKEYILGVLHDVTPMLEKDKEVRDSAKRIRELQDNIPIGIFTTAMDGRILYANRQLRRLLGLDPAAEWSDTPMAIDFYKNKADRDRIVDKLLKDGRVNNEEIMVSPLRGKPFWSRTSIRVMRDGDGNPVRFDGTLENISAEKKARQEADRANRKADRMLKDLQRKVGEALQKHDRQQSLLVQKSKLESLGELAAGIAHEINQPLGIMALSFENLQARLRDGKADEEYLQQKFRSIEGNIRRIRTIIDHIRDFSREQGLPALDKISLNKIVYRSLMLIGAQYMSHDIHLEINLKEDLGFTVGSNMKLEQAILNLLSNAKYALEEKALLQGHNEFTKTIDISTRQTARKVILSIRDNGTGIPEKNIGKVFDPFFTTKPEGLGTGLGLSIAYGIVREMRGEIQARSEEGKFTEFVISFPRLPEK